MPKRYRGKFSDDLNFTLFMHPSNWMLSYLTKNVAACLVTTGIVVGSISFLNAILGAPVITTFLMLLGFVWYGYAISVVIRSKRILRKNYNEYLYPIEAAYNNMNSKDQEKYASILSDAYDVCARRDYNEFNELEKTRELFELTAPDSAKPMKLEEELALKRKELKEKKDFQEMQQSILDELK